MGVNCVNFDADLQVDGGDCRPTWQVPRDLFTPDRSFIHSVSLRASGTDGDPGPPAHMWAAGRE